MNKPPENQKSQNDINERLKQKLKEMSLDPSAQIKQLAIGTLLSLLAMSALVLTSEIESQWLFYALSFVLAIGVLYAIPGYIGVWVWRMRDVFFKE